MDELFRGVISEVKLAILNFANVRKADAQTVSEFSLRHPFVEPKFFDSYAELHFVLPANCQADAKIVCSVNFLVNIAVHISFRDS